MTKKKTNYSIYKKSVGYPFPGEYWEEFTTHGKAKREFNNYDPKHFRLVKTTYEDVHNVKLRLPHYD